MSGFVSSAPSIAADNPGDDADVVLGDGWYPALSISGARDSMILPSVVTDRRIRDALRAAILSARRELKVWKAAHVAAGVAALADVDPETIDGEPVAVLLYQRAVYAFAGADLAETHNDITATAEGKTQAEGRVLSADEHRRNATHAIRDLLGVTRTAVELL